MVEPFKQGSPVDGSSLRVIQVGDDEYFVESSQGKICYQVKFGPGGHSCTCGDFTSRIKQEPAYGCKHINAILDQEGTIPRIDLNQRIRPKLDDRFLSSIKERNLSSTRGFLISHTN